MSAMTIFERIMTGGGASSAGVVMAALVLGPVFAPGLGAAAFGQETDAPPPATRPAASADPPSLDELLGLDEEAPPSVPAERITEQEAEAELQRRLDEEAPQTAFRVAIQKMNVAAEQLDGRFDTGLGTQRAQEEVLARLAHLIDEAKKNQGGNPMSSAGSSSPSPSQDPGKQQQSSSPSPPESGDGQRTNGESQPGDAATAQQDGDMNPLFDESRSEWGNLPQRIREMLLQGRREKFSSLYEELTREYYRRLAEDGSS